MGGSTKAAMPRSGSGGCVGWVAAPLACLLLGTSTAGVGACKFACPDECATRGTEYFLCTRFTVAACSAATSFRCGDRVPHCCAKAAPAAPPMRREHCTRRACDLDPDCCTTTTTTTTTIAQATRAPAANQLVLTITGTNGQTVRSPAELQQILSSRDNPGDDNPVLVDSTLPRGPSIIDFVARDPDNRDSRYSDGDVLRVVFDYDTSAPPAHTKAQLDGLFVFEQAGGMVNLGAAYRGVWASASVLDITVTDTRRAGGRPAPAVGALRVRMRAAGVVSIAGVPNSRNSLEPSEPLRGDFGRSHDVSWFYWGVPLIVFGAVTTAVAIRLTLVARKRGGSRVAAAASPGRGRGGSRVGASIGRVVPRARGDSSASDDSESDGEHDVHGRPDGAQRPARPGAGRAQPAPDHPPPAGPGAPGAASITHSRPPGARGGGGGKTALAPRPGALVVTQGVPAGRGPRDVPPPRRPTVRRQGVAAAAAVAATSIPPRPPRASAQPQNKTQRPRQAKLVLGMATPPSRSGRRINMPPPT